MRTPSPQLLDALERRMTESGSDHVARSFAEYLAEQRGRIAATRACRSRISAAGEARSSQPARRSSPIGVRQFETNWNSDDRPKMSRSSA